MYISKRFRICYSISWYDPKTFKTKEFEEYANVDNGDMNWIIPNKFLAFSSPSPSQYDSEGYCTYTPEDYFLFLKNGTLD